MKIAMLLSGGVDSSVALKLLQDQGQHLTVFYVKIWLEDNFSYLGKCPWQDDLKYVEAVCDKLKVPLEIVNLQKEYWDKVVQEVIGQVKAGHTPNPDILCNSLIKFGVFYEHIGGEFKKVASGHYARVEKDVKFMLKKSSDPVKDQTYFLARLNQAQLGRLVFPIGHLTKGEVRRLAQKFNLPNQRRKDSQGICFLGQIKYRDFLRGHLGVKKGKLIHKKSGRAMGEHDGFWYYTIGQRKDIKLSGGPWYVIAKEADKNIIYIGGQDELKDNARAEFTVADLNWIAGQAPQAGRFTVKVRHGAKEYGCFIEESEGGSWRVKMDEADKGLAAGQQAVFYKGEICLGGGVIMKHES